MVCGIFEHFKMYILILNIGTNIQLKVVICSNRKGKFSGFYIIIAWIFITSYSNHDSEQ